MLKKIFSSYGIDFEQWKAILRTTVRLANRQSSLRFDTSSGQGRSMNYAILFSALMYSVMGLMLTGFVYAIQDPFWSSLIVFTIVAFMIGSMMLVEFSAIVVAPEDYQILSVQPVSSRTYFAAKVAFTMLYVLLYTLAIGLPSVLTFALNFRLHKVGVSVDPLQMLAALVALLMVGIGMAMAMILLYATILRRVHIARLNRVLSYLQLMMSFVVYGSYGLLPSVVTMVNLHVPAMKPWWVYLIPTSWYSSFLNLSSGASIAAAVAGSLFFLGVIPIAFSKISLTYAESLSEATAVVDEKAAPRRSSRASLSILLRRPEDRAIATLIRSQFKHDTRFRLGILAIVPLTILYILMGLRGGGKLFDPFNPDWKALGNSMLLYMVVVIFPMTMKEAVTRSESYLASWIFFATPAEKARLVLAVKRILFWYFVVPYLLVLGLVFQFYFKDILHVLMHVLMLLLFSHTFLQIYLLVSPQMPFSVPRQLGERATLITTILIVGPIILMATLLILSFFVYKNILMYIGAVGLLASISTLMENLLVRRISRKLGRLEFRG